MKSDINITRIDNFTLSFHSIRNRLANTYTACPATGSKYATIQPKGSAVFNVGACN